MVHGFDYVPENLRSLSFIEAAKKLKQIHYEFNYFYNEKEAAKELERLGTQIPKPAIKETISACLLCLTGNVYGASVSARPILYSILDKMGLESWKYYFEECFPFDEDLLLNLAYGDKRNEKWCSIVNDYRLFSIETKDGRINEMLIASKNNENNRSNVVCLYLETRHYHMQTFS